LTPNSLEFLNVTGNTTIHRHRDWGRHATEFLQHGRRHRGWSVEEHPSPLPGTRVFDILLDDAPVTHCSLCLKQEASDKFWRYVRDLPFIRFEIPRQPSQVPWLAVHLVQGSFDLVRQNSPRILEIADLETAVAWDLIDRECP
jgi:hypothetical protein